MGLKNIVYPAQVPRPRGLSDLANLGTPVTAMHSGPGDALIFIGTDRPIEWSIICLRTLLYSAPR